MDSVELKRSNTALTSFPADALWRSFHLCDFERMGYNSLHRIASPIALPSHFNFFEYSVEYTFCLFLSDIVLLLSAR